MVNKKNEGQENKNFKITFRVIQAFFLGILALGISSSLGDYFRYISFPIGSFSITTTVFGLIGSIMTGILAKQSEKW